MASFNLQINYPDGEGPRIVAALRSRYQKEGQPPLTQAQAIEAFRQSVLNSLRDIVQREEEDAAVAAATASVVKVTPS